MTAQMSRRSILKLSLLASSAGLLAACSGAPAPSTPAPAAAAPAPTAPAASTAASAPVAQSAGSSAAPVTIRFLANKLSEDLPKKEIEKQTNAFQADNKNVKVNLEPVAVADYVQKFTVQMAAKSGPDLVEYGSGDFLSFQSQNFLADHNPFIDKEGGDKFRGIYEKKYFDISTKDGKAYGLPIWTATLALAYNAQWFKDVGLDPEQPPKTWDDFVAYGKKLTRNSKGGNGPADQWGIGLYGMRHEVATRYLYIWYWTNGANIFNADVTKATLNDAKGLEAFTWYTGLYGQGIVGPMLMSNAMQDIYKDWANQRVNMFTVGPWLRHFVRASVPEMEKNLRSAPFPQHTQPGVGTNGTTVYGLTTESKNPDATWQYLKFMGTPKNLVSYGLINDFIPPVVGAADMKEFKDDPWLKIFVAQLPNAQLLPSHPRINDCYLVIADALQSVWLKKKEPKQAADDAQQQLDKILSEK